MHHWILLMLTQRPNCAWRLTGRESEQDVFSHSVCATEVVPVEKKEPYLSAGLAYLVIRLVQQRDLLIYNSKARREALGL